MTTKRCRDCGESKAITEFGRYRQSPDRIHLYCKVCMSDRNAARYRERQAKAGKTVRPFRRHLDVPAGQKYCPACQEIQPVANFGKNRAARSGLTAYCLPCHNRISRENVVKRHGSTRDFHLKRRYGVTSAGVRSIVARQGGVCAICRRPEPDHVDHCHWTSMVRGVLCFTCNGALGQFDDDPWRLRQAALYLEGRVEWLNQVVEELEVSGVSRLLPRNRPGEGSKSRREYKLRHKYGVSEPWVDGLSRLQHGRCAICMEAPITHVDHDHGTGVFRGLLCTGCNSGMGMLGDDPEVVRSAAFYCTAEFARPWARLDERGMWCAISG
ncbi:endonuclease domain-containing protein [Actinocorallia sp. A-T 12471]|uniref:endonuclease domain-containing protein n=1 Tax=Actinocorallia sp. A-T 12471 TaxID=3089813 RepID=UPI0029D3C587|nr:endonuclease domain-containing protein [Actinocorallia sp. A-T 12471]MDX6744276.1 endonuclease domain-containing protein [Actinocorallia sp. A-T 12471]